jgi:hypothetical protein
VELAGLLERFQSRRHGHISGAVLAQDMAIFPRREAWFERFSQNFCSPRQQTTRPVSILVIT